MLAGVLPERLWPTTGLTSRTWLNQPVAVFEIATLWACQRGVHFAHLIGPPPEPYGGDPLPHVVIWNGERVIEDGHHRVMRALLAGQRHIEARWVEVG